MKAFWLKITAIVVLIVVGLIAVKVFLPRQTPVTTSQNLNLSSYSV